MNIQRSGFLMDILTKPMNGESKNPIPYEWRIQKSNFINLQTCLGKISKVSAFYLEKQ